MFVVRPGLQFQLALPQRMTQTNHPLPGDAQANIWCTIPDRSGQHVCGATFASYNAPTAHQRSDKTPGHTLISLGHAAVVANMCLNCNCRFARNLIAQQHFQTALTTGVCNN